MRISRKKKKFVPKKDYQFNERISVSEVMVLGEEGENLGVMSTSDGIKTAKEKELDLVIINPKSTPQVARIMDYGQFKYQKEKEDRKKKANTHITDTKGIRLSLRIGPHDIEIRKKQSLKFLDNGDKVKVEIILRGRENKQKDLAKQVIQTFMDSINEVVEIRVEQAIESQGNKITSLIAKQ